jgi:hypothetical protein
MSETIPETVPETVTDPTVTDTESIEYYKAQADKWKNLSRKHEQTWKETSKENETLRQSLMTDQEKALEAAKAEGRSAALSEVGRRLAAAELRVAAATAGVALPEAVAGLLDVSQLLAADGTPDTDAINTLVGSLGSVKPPAPTFAQNTGVGPQGSTGQQGQLTQDDLKRMTPAQINQARKDGLLNNLMFGG